MKIPLADEQQKFPMPVLTDFRSGLLGEDVRIERASKTIDSLQNLFENEAERQKIDADTVVYAVEYWKPVSEGTEGGLFWGNSTVYPGVVGEEYFMTRGHFHACRKRAEYYATVSGNGLLLLMDEQRNSSVQEMAPGTTHYIPGEMAHRVVNTGETPLTFLACWPSDAGHDYATINERGFSARVMRRNGQPKIVNQG